jgi:hypothetical protein
MNANDLAKLLEVDSWYKLVTREEIADTLRQQQVEIEVLNTRITRMVEKHSHYEAMAHAGGFEAGRQLGMKQERALWELAASTQEIDNG